MDKDWIHAAELLPTELMPNSANNWIDAEFGKKTEFMPNWIDAEFGKTELMPKPNDWNDADWIDAEFGMTEMMPTELMPKTWCHYV